MEGDNEVVVVIGVAVALVMDMHRCEALEDVEDMDELRGRPS